MDNKIFLNFLIIILCLLLRRCASISNHHVIAINHNDYGQNVQVPPDKIRWEIGLREATYQALRREHISQSHLKDEIYSAPILGFQDSATPFGDIAILARGQLYSTPIGYKFVQDAYRNDCDDCHNRPHRCTNNLCKPHQDTNSKSLIALWTVKRIRHRDLNKGQRFELQFTVSPMSPAAPREFVTRNGHFDYNIPGHVFIIKVKNSGQTSRLNYNRSEKYKVDSKPSWSNHHSDTFTPNTLNYQTGEFYVPHKKPKPELDPNYAGYLIGISNNYKPDAQITEHSHEVPFVTTKTHDKLQTPPKEPVKHYHHHFYIPEVTDVDLDHKTEKPTLSKPHDSTQKFILTTGSGSSQTIPLITDHAYAFKNSHKFLDTTIPIPVQPIIFSPANKFHTLPTFTPDHNTIFKIISIPTATQATPFHPSPVFIQYSEPDPTYSNNEPPTVAGYITTEPVKTSFYPEISTIKLFEHHTEIPMTTTTEKPKFPDSINAQLPPPKNGLDTTIPYVSSTTVVSITPRPTKYKYKDSETISTNIHTSPELTTVKIEPSTNQIEDETEYLTTPVSKSIESFTTTQNKIERYQTQPTTTIPMTTDTPKTTMIMSTVRTTSKKRYGRPYNYRPSYVDDLDIFADNKTEKTKTSQHPVVVTTQETVVNEEVFPDVQTTALTTEILKNQRISKYLKYKQRNRNSNRLQKFRNYNSERLRQRQNATKTTLQQLTHPTDTIKTDPIPDDDKVETKTSQSLITSISFKVNRNGRRYNDFARPAILPANHDRTMRPVYHHTATTKEYNVFQEPLPETTTEMQYTKAFDDIAQTLVNHARAVSYLESRTTTPLIATTNSHK